MRKALDRYNFGERIKTKVFKLAEINDKSQEMIYIGRKRHPRVNS